MTEGLDLRDRVAKQITIYVEPKMDTYMGVPLFSVWYKGSILFIMGGRTLLRHGLREAAYPHADDRHVSYPEAKEAV